MEGRHSIGGMNHVKGAGEGWIGQCVVGGGIYSRRFPTNVCYFGDTLVGYGKASGAGTSSLTTYSSNNGHATGQMFAKYSSSCES